MYLLLSPVALNTFSTTTEGQSKSSSFPFGLIVGPGITGLNMIVAGTANKNFSEEPESNGLYRQMKNGETIYALVAFENIGIDEITLHLK